MKIILLLGLFPKEYKKEIIQNSNGVIQYAADALQWAIVDGLSSLYDNIDVVNFPYVGSYPFRYKSCFLPNGKFLINAKKNKLGESYSFTNLSILKNVSRYLGVRKALKKIVLETEGNITILVYAVHLPFVQAALDMKNRYKNVKVCVMVPDLPEFMDETVDISYKIFNRIKMICIDKCYKNIDSFIFLTEHMAEKIPVRNKKWLVIEGIYKNENAVRYVDYSKHERIIFYSGTLAKRYGVLNLVKAFMLINNPDYRLLICGDGDSKGDILLYAQNDSRISYVGQLAREEVLSIQKSADLLVNPRTPEGVFTRYSFPSKTMEYLASGTPTLMYRLPGIPNEYYDYCYTIDSLDVLDLSKKMEEILRQDSKYLELYGKKARDFILKNKTPKKQCLKILNFINN